MGNSAASKNKKGDNIMLIGLYNSGKRTLQDKLMNNPGGLPKFVSNTGIDSSGHNGINIMATDIGGRDVPRPLLRYFLKKVDAVIFIVDSTAIDEEGFTKNYFHLMASEEESLEIPVLVLANKQDLPEALSVQEVDEKLEVTKLKQQNQMRVLEMIPTSLHTGEGVWAAVEWIQHHLQIKHAYQTVVKPVQKAVPPPLASFYASMSSGLKRTFRTMKKAVCP